MTKKTPESTIKQMLEMAKKNIPYKEIAEKFGTNKDMVSRILTREGFSALRNKKNSKLNVEAVKHLIENEGYSINKTASELGISSTAVTNICKKNGIVTSKKNRDNRRGKKFTWTEEKINKLIEMYLSEDYSHMDVINYFQISTSTLHAKVKELGLVKTRSKHFVTKGERDFFEKFHDKMTVEEMAKIYNISSYRLSKKLFYLGLIDILPASPDRKAMPSDEEFLKDYHDPYISHSSLAAKYSLSASQISHWRMRDFGKNFLVTKSPTNFATSIENKVKEILLDLDITFIQQHRIDIYTVDFYLGNKSFIECNGSYWHLYKEKTIKKDKRKREFFQSNEYSFLSLTDEEIENDPESVSNKIRVFYLESIRPLLSELD